MLARAIVLASAAAVASSAALPKLFGHAIKNGPITPWPSEWTTFEHNCSTPPCVVTQLHVPSIAPADDCPWDWERGRLLLWLDDPVTPVVNITLLQLAAIGHKASVGVEPPLDGSPWGNELFGRTALQGGVYSTVRFPFQKYLRAALMAPPSCNVTAATQTAWMYIRGYEGYRVVLGTDLVLPPDAKLVVQQNINTTVDVLDYLQVAAAEAGTAGALLLVQMTGDSSQPVYLEACWRLYTGNDSAPFFLSSGSEDLFLSAYYFSEMLYHTSQAGLTYDDHVSCVSAFKVFTRDLVLFSNGFKLMLRNWENEECPTGWGSDTSRAPSLPMGHRRGPDGKVHHLGDPAPVNYTTTAWFYTWSNTSSPKWAWTQTEDAPAASTPLPASPVTALLDLVAAGWLSPDVEQAALAALDAEDTAVGRSVARVLSSVRGASDLPVVAGVLTRLLQQQPRPLAVE